MCIAWVNTHFTRRTVTIIGSKTLSVLFHNGKCVESLIWRFREVVWDVWLECRSPRLVSLWDELFMSTTHSRSHWDVKQIFIFAMLGSLLLGCLRSVIYSTRLRNVWFRRPQLCYNLGRLRTFFENYYCHKNLGLLSLVCPWFWIMNHL